MRAARDDSAGQPTDLRGGDAETHPGGKAIGWLEELVAAAKTGVNGVVHHGVKLLLPQVQKGETGREVKG